MSESQQSLLYLFRNSEYLSMNDKILLQNVYSEVFNKCNVNSPQATNGMYTYLLINNII